MAQKRVALEGVRITDFCWWGVGAYCTRILGNLGAEVIRIESGTSMDPTRGAQPIRDGATGVNVSGYFNNFNPSKVGISLNLNHPKGREIALRLVAISDVVTDSFTPHVMEKWGLLYEDLVKVRPDIIAASIPVMGRSGPYRDWGCYGHQIESMAGLASLAGLPGRPPIGTGEAWPDFTSNPYHAATAILAALHYRRRTGKGQCIEVAQFESTVCFVGPAVLEYTANSRIPSPAADRVPHAAPHGVYRCKGEDRWCALTVFTDAQWEAFKCVIGSPCWCSEPRFATFLGRKVAEDELDVLITQWTVEKTAEEVMMLMQHAGVPAGVLQTGEDLLVRDPHIKAREFHVACDHPEAGRITYDGVPFKLSKTPGRLQRTHLFGEHNDYVYHHLLGMSEEEIGQCYVDGVFD